MSPRTIRVLVIASVLCVFLGGLVTGYVLGRREPATVAPPQRERLIDQFARELALTGEQRAAIQAVLRDGERTVREAMQRVRPELEAKRSAMERSILDVLTPAQREQYRAMLPDGLPRPPPPGRGRPPHDEPPPP